MNASKLSAILQTRFDATFGGYAKLKGFDAQIWSEGGEWPIFDSINHRSSVRNPQFRWPTQVVAGRDIEHVIRVLSESFKTHDQLAVAMVCGAGKSTRLMASILDRLCYSTVVCIQPSSVAADEIRDYVSSLYPNLIVARKYTRNVKSLIYLSASEFLTLLHASADLPDTLVVVDEYHSINPVYKAMQCVLSCIRNKVLCMTASNSSDLSKRDGVRITSHKEFDQDVNKLINSLSSNVDNTSLILGCCPGYKLYNAANHYVGVTVGIKLMVDLSTRLDPTIQGNALIMTYRAASVTELTQSLGRLARVVGSYGQYHYFPNASPFTLAGYPTLYSRIYGALISAFGMGLESNTKSLCATLKCSTELVISSSSTSVASSVYGDVKSPSLSYGKTRTTSIASSSSSVRPARDTETMKVTKSSTGYFVDYVPNDPVQRALSMRARTWTSKSPVDNFPVSSIRQDMLLSNLNKSNYDVKANDTQTRLMPQHILHPSDMQIVNDILSGKSIPSYTSDEFALVKKAWAVYLQLNPNRTSQSSVLIEKNISDYYDAYKRLADVYVNAESTL